jgi:PhoPQ-activated pathogenicity-related protein
MLNFIENIHHMYRNYNGWTWAMHDYTEVDYCAHIDDPNNQILSMIIDGYFYRERLTMPKLVVNAGGDEFFMPDDTHWWWKDMPDPKHFLMVPNAEHSQATGILEVVPAIGSFIRTV